MTKGNKRLALSMMLPAFMEQMLLNLFIIADSFMLGRLQDAAAPLAAISVAGPTTTFIPYVSTSFCIGITASVSQFYGAGDLESGRATARQSFLITTLFGLFVSVICATFAEPIIGLLKASPEVAACAVPYFRWIAYGYLFYISSSCITAILRGIGMTRLPMLYNIASGVVKLFLNWLLIFGRGPVPQMGIMGAAMATTLSRGVLLLISLFMLFCTKTKIRISLREDWRITWGITPRFLRIGWMTALEQIILQFGAILSTKIVAVLPTNQLAAYSITNSIELIGWAIGNGANAATTTLAGMSVGAGKPELGKAYTFYMLKVSMLMMGGFMALFAVFCPTICRFFTPDITVASLAVPLTRIMLLEMPFVNAHVNFAGALRGAGDTRPPLVASMVSLWTARVGLGFLCIRVLGMDAGAMRAAIVLDQMIRASICTCGFLRGRWMRSGLKK